MVNKRTLLGLLMTVMLMLMAMAPAVSATADTTPTTPPPPPPPTTPPPPETRTEIQCFVTNEAITLYDFVDMSALGLAAPELNGGQLIVTQMAGDVVEYGYYTADYGYQVLGWGWIVDDVQYYSANENGLLTQAQLEAAMAAFGSVMRTNCVEVEVENLR